MQQRAIEERENETAYCLGSVRLLDALVDHQQNATAKLSIYQERQRNYVIYCLLTGDKDHLQTAAKSKRKGKERPLIASGRLDS
jgi:hypothetical protein